MAKPSPRSPPRIRRKLPAEDQILDREIGFLKEELHSLEGLPSVHRFCKEVHEFIGSNPDPLIPINKKKHKSCRILEWLRTKLCLNCSWMCCSCLCSLQLETPRCSNQRRPRTCCCCSCGLISCCRPQCLRPSLPSPGCSCGCAWSCCPNCIEIRLCPRCTKTCSKQCLC